MSDNLTTANLQKKNNESELNKKVINRKVVEVAVEEEVFKKRILDLYMQQLAESGTSKKETPQIHPVSTDTLVKVSKDPKQSSDLHWADILFEKLIASFQTISNPLHRQIFTNAANAIGRQGFARLADQAQQIAGDNTKGKAKANNQVAQSQPSQTTATSQSEQATVETTSSTSTQSVEKDTRQRSSNENTTSQSTEESGEYQSYNAQEFTDGNDDLLGDFRSAKNDKLSNLSNNQLVSNYRNSIEPRKVFAGLVFNEFASHLEYFAAKSFVSTSSVTQESGGQFIACIQRSIAYFGGHLPLSGLQPAFTNKLGLGGAPRDMGVPDSYAKLGF